MSPLQLLRCEAIRDVMLLELRDTVGITPDYAILDEFEAVRRQRRSLECNKVVFDLAQAMFFGSTLLELIRMLWNDLAEVHGQLVLCNPSRFGREVLGIAKFDQIWPLVETREQALSLLSSDHQVATWPAPLKQLITQYQQGPLLLRDALSGFSSIQLRTPSPPGVWSTLQVVCHLADFELVYADRMKRVIAEDQPTLFSGDPDQFAARLAYRQRDLEDELDVIISVRRSTAALLKTLDAADFDRTGRHSVDGPVTLSQLLERIVGHIPHHIEMINGKKQALIRTT